MENTNENVETTTEKLTYQFTAVPTKLMMLLDNNCRSMLFTLMQLDSYFADEDGYFFRSNSDLQTESNLSKNLVIVTIDTLYTNGIVDVKCGGNKCKKIANYYKLNYNKILEYENISIEDTKNPDNKITTLKYKNSDYVPSYKTATDTAKSEHQKEVVTNIATDTATDTAKSEHQKPQKVNTNIDSININNKENYIYNNTIKEKEEIICANANTGDLSKVGTITNEILIPTEKASENESKQVNNELPVPSLEEVNRKILNDIELYFNPTYYNGKGLVWYEVINTIQHYANEIRNYIQTNITNNELKNTYCSTINKLCDDVCDEIRTNYANKNVA